MTRARQSADDDDHVRWQRLQELFANSVALDGEERRRYVHEACAGDAALKTALEALLDAERRTGGDRFVHRAIAAAALRLADAERRGEAGG
ncbi:MAG TPA: hypothetical protein VH539_18895 [Gemmatimonadaceae bacterium]|jgi:hypothetical protein